MKGTWFAAIVAMAITLGGALAAPAQADPDANFERELHTYGIYGPRDYNAWLGKITCKRLDKGVDANANESAGFDLKNLPRGTTQVQSWQFLGAAIKQYCPAHIPVLQASAQHG